MWLLILLCLPLLITTENLKADNFVPRSYVDLSGKTISYELVIPPGYDKTKKYPAIVIYHGTGESGTGVLTQHAGISAVDRPAVQYEQQFPTFVIFTPTSTDEASALKVVASLTPEFNIDPDQIYTRGLPFEARSYTSPEGKTLPYELYTPPDYDKTRQYPVILFFHGSSERGSDNFEQLRNGALNYGLPDFQGKNPCFVIVPQCPADGQWVDMPWGVTNVTRPVEASAPMKMALKVLDGIESEFSIDPDRVYAVGLSMGGYGVWDCVTRYPNRFAAGVLWCGGGDPKSVTAEVAQVPVWGFHSVDDPVVPIACDRNMIDAMTKMGGHPKFTEYTGFGHYSWNKAFDEPDLFPWLFQQRLNQRAAVAK